MGNLYIKILLYVLLGLTIYSLFIDIKDMFFSKIEVVRCVFVRDQSMGTFTHAAIILYNGVERLCLGSYKWGTYMPGELVNVYKVGNRFYINKSNNIGSIILLSLLLVFIIFLLYCQ